MKKASFERSSCCGQAARERLGRHGPARVEASPGQREGGPKPRNPRHLDKIEGRRSYRSSVKGTFGQYIECVRHSLATT